MPLRKMDAQAVLLLGESSAHRAFVIKIPGMSVPEPSEDILGSGYNERRAQVEEASRLLGVPQLRDVHDVSQLSVLPELLHRRARHVVSENARVLEALTADAARFGTLMNASHASLQGDYQVSHPQVDVLVALLQAHPQVYGARMTGAGFGGAVVALVQEGHAAQVAAEVLAQYGIGGRMVVP